MDESYKTFCCRGCGEPGMTKESNHYTIVKDLKTGENRKVYECPFSIDYYEKTERLKRESLC